MGKKILIIHYRTGERDGVSLEIEKRRSLLEELGHEVKLVTGYDPRLSRDRNILLIEELDIKRRLSSVLRESFFKQKILDNNIAWLIFHSEEEKIYTSFLKILKKEKPNLIFIHNIFSAGYHLPATTAIIKVLDRLHYPTVCVHHDFWWERNMFHKTKYYFINDILESLPPKRDFIISHQVINSLARQKLMERVKIKNPEIIGDFFDFDKKFALKDDFNSDFLSTFGIFKGDLVILHSTRIVERKAIENAIFFTAVLGRFVKKKVHLLLPNFIEADSQEYFKRLKKLAEEMNVSFIWIGDRVAMERQQKNGRKIYSFWDSYLFADLMTYTSFAEGYGNQLLEAFWARLLPVVFEYPVFKSDIKKEGYEYISLGDKLRKRNEFNFVDKDILTKAAKQTLKYLTNKNLYSGAVNKNLELASRYHDTEFLKNNLSDLITRAS